MNTLEQALTEGIKALREADAVSPVPLSVFLSEAEEHLRPYFGPNCVVHRVRKITREVG